MDKLRLYCISLCAEETDNEDRYRIIRDEGEYDGETNEKGQKHGYGRFLFSNGDTYEGEWKRDKMHGSGEYRSASGEVYKGSFKKGKRIQNQQSVDRTSLRSHLLPQDEIGLKRPIRNQPRQERREGSLEAFAGAARNLSKKLTNKKSKKRNKYCSEEQMPSSEVDGPIPNRPVRGAEAIPQERVRRAPTMNEKLRKDAEKVKAKWNFRRSR